MTEQRHSAVSASTVIELSLPPATARTVERSLTVEAGDLVDERSKTRIERDGTVVRIVIEAADRTALRAAANTWLGLVGTAEETADLVRHRV